MLTYAFDLLFAIYEEEGYAPSEIPALILRHNLYGLEICPRAAALAEMALVFKAREKSRRFFQKEVMETPRIVTMQDVHFDEGELQEYARAQKLEKVLDESIVSTLESFEHASTFGSLIVPKSSEAEIQRARQAVEEAGIAKNLMVAGTATKVLLALEMAEMLTQRYHVVVANPPYLGGKNANQLLKTFASSKYPESKADLFAMFIERGFSLVEPYGYSAMVTMQSWMFLSSYEKLRKRLLTERTIISMCHMENMVMGIAFGTCATIWSNNFVSKIKGSYSQITMQDLNDLGVPTIFPVRNERLVEVYAEEFKKIPGSPIAYWASERVREIFDKGEPLLKIARPRQGMASTNNGLFVRCWHEVDFSKASLQETSEATALQSGAKWFPYNKGGEFRRWYGNNNFFINYENGGKTICDYIDNTPGAQVGSNGRVINRDKFFKPCITWSFISSTYFGVRQSDKGFIFDVAGSSAFPPKNMLNVLTGFLCSDLAFNFMHLLNPTLNFQVGNVGSLPILLTTVLEKQNEIEMVVSEAVQISRTDWNSFETSWDFTTSPLLPADKSTFAAASTTVAACYAEWESACNARRARLQQLEEENNRLFIDAYGLQDELSPEVPDDQITIAVPDPRRDMAALLSYAVGVMMGRYELSVASDQWAVDSKTAVDSEKLTTDHCSLTTDDGVIPILDGEWSQDDIVARTRDFLRAAFGAEHLAENVRFIEDALGKDLRKYFLTDFYKDHLQTYKKRPIYWMVQSPKKGFRCLIYLHRYTRDTMNVVLNRYLREYQNKLHNHINHLQRIATSDAPPRDKAVAAKEADKLHKVLRECQDWERDTILPLAQARVDLDLDDGVKVNYQKLGDALAVIPGLCEAVDSDQ